MFAAKENVYTRQKLGFDEYPAEGDASQLVLQLSSHVKNVYFSDLSFIYNFKQ